MAYRRKSSVDEYADKIPFNNAFGKLYRIGQWWEKAFQAKTMNLIDEYYNLLESIQIEIYAHLSVDERKETDELIKKIEQYLDQSNIPPGQEGVGFQNRRLASNKCDALARRLVLLLHKYDLEWFDIKAWQKEQRENEPIMRG